MNYLVLEDEAELDALEKALGRAHADAGGKAYPLEPDVVGPGAFPCGLERRSSYADLPPELRASVARQEHYRRAARDWRAGRAGGLLLVDEVTAKLEGAVVQLEGGKEHVLELEHKTITKEQLSQEWREVLEGKKGVSDGRDQREDEPERAGAELARPE